MATCRGPGAGVTSGACRVRFVPARARMRGREDGGLAYPQTTRVRMPRISCEQETWGSAHGFVRERVQFCTRTDKQELYSMRGIAGVTEEEVERV